MERRDDGSSNDLRRGPAREEGRPSNSARENGPAARPGFGPRDNGDSVGPGPRGRAGFGQREEAGPAGRPSPRGLGGSGSFDGRGGNDAAPAERPQRRSGERAPARRDTTAPSDGNQNGPSPLWHRHQNNNQQSADGSADQT
ncbi:MAG TPA: hypothetical protein VFE47_01310 [Tepidisphaeraceae bacterium]|nr:hypothetical protein [Tepidisphaeraceae bacterium]